MYVDSNISQIGISRGGQEIQRCKDRFRALLIILVRIASLQVKLIVFITLICFLLI